jgi:hypothetical protein
VAFFLEKSETAFSKIFFELFLLADRFIYFKKKAYFLKLKKQLLSKPHQSGISVFKICLLIISFF